MEDTPTVDGRRRDDVREHLHAIAPAYLEEWEPGTGGPGDAVLESFAAMAGDLLERLDHAPEKHRVAFFDALGFGRRPPQPATVPVTFTVAADAGENAPIPAGTELDAATDEGDHRFRVRDGDGFEATPARLRDVYAVDPGTDRLVAHGESVDGVEAATLFDGPNLQEHALYVGHPERLAVSGEATIQLAVDGVPADLLADLRWEFYGEAGPEGAVGWHELDQVEPTTFALADDEALVETERNGVEGPWIRCRVPDGERPERFDVEFGRLSFGSPTDAVDVDGLYANDVPQPGDGGTIRPFGSIPRLRDAFYVGCGEAFTKRGATVTVTFEDVSYELPTNADAADVDLSWEYFDGDAWQRLPLEGAGDEAAALPGEVTFVVPDDVDGTTVAGQEGVWIRVRLVGGQFVDVRYEEDTETTADLKRVVDGEPPEFEAVDVEYSYDESVAASPTHVFASNNGAFGGNLADRASFRPFEPLPDATQTVYLGFDGPLRGGPVQLFVDVDERTYPEEFAPRLAWEYCVDPAEDAWTRLHGSDGTDGLTGTGIVSLSFPGETTAFERFGRGRHWIRARVRGDEFDLAAGADRPTATGPADGPDCGPRRCRPVLGTGLATGPPTTAPPTVDGVYVNAGRASNVDVVEDERLGSSDGSPGATFAVADPPVVELDVWVDELTALSAAERERLLEDRPDGVEVERDRDGELASFWVRWEPVADLLASGPDDRHYVVDRVAGEVTFGDGTAGRIPPHGRDNVRASYRTGGGAGGNVPPGTVGSLVSPLELVEAVTNPVGGSGGAPAESTGAVLERAPKALRDRGRAVTAADFERIALDASRRLAEVRAIPGMNRAGEHEPGWVTLVVVPDDGGETPVPSPGLRRQVRDAVSDRAPLALVSGDHLVVRGPTYVSTRVDATVYAEAGERLGAVEDRVEDALSAYLHPLSGAGGDGWAFGDLPTVSDAFAVVERCRGVDHVDSLQVHFEGTREDVSTSGGDPPPESAPDVLVRSGAHELVVEPYERCGGDD